MQTQLSFLQLRLPLNKLLIPKPSIYYLINLQVMRTLQALFAIILVFNVASMELKTHSSLQTINQVPPTPTPQCPSQYDQNLRLFLLGDVYRNFIRRIGFYINESIFLLENTNMSNILNDNAVDTIVTPLYTVIFSQLNPRTDVSPIQKESYLVKIQDQHPPAIYLINPIRNHKWKMTNISNIYNYGLNETRINIVSTEFVNQYPTAYYF